MARPKKEKELNQYHLVNARLSDIELENIDQAATATSFDEFQKLLLEKYKISVTDKRGRYSYLHPDRTQPITERALGTNYGKAELINKFAIKLKELNTENASVND